MNRLFHASLLASASMPAMVRHSPNGLGSAAVNLDHPEPAQPATGDYAPVDLATIGYSGKTIPVHKLNEEGVLIIDAVTGAVMPGQHDRPEWSEGLQIAMLAERTQFYTTRTGNAPAEAEVLAFEDLNWLYATDEDDSERTIPASDEFRLDAVATILGIDRETGEVTNALVLGEIARDDYRSDEQMAALTDAQQAASFEEHQKRTGTGG